MMAEPFHLSHLDGLDVTERERDLMVEHEGLAATVMREGRVLAVVGARDEGDAMEVWAVLSDEAKRQRVMTCRVAKQTLDALLKKHGRLRARVESDIGKRWAMHLGFRFNGDVGELLWQ